MILYRYVDDFGNRAEIEKIRLYPYKGAPQKVPGYMVSCFGMYQDAGLMYHRSIFETLKDAENDIKKLSCGTFVMV